MQKRKGQTVKNCLTAQDSRESTSLQIYLMCLCSPPLLAPDHCECQKSAQTQKQSKKSTDERKSIKDCKHRDVLEQRLPELQVSPEVCHILMLFSLFPLLTTTTGRTQGWMDFDLAWLVWCNHCCNKWS